MTQDIQAQLADLQTEADFDAWADARCAEYEAEEGARHCLGGANDARSQGWVDYTDEENAYYADLERQTEEYDRWYEEEGCYRETEDRALIEAYSGI